MVLGAPTKPLDAKVGAAIQGHGARTGLSSQGLWAGRKTGVVRIRVKGTGWGVEDTTFSRAISTPGMQGP